MGMTLSPLNILCSRRSAAQSWKVEDVKPIGDWARLGTRNSIRATKESYKWMRCWWRWWMAVGNWKLHIFSPFNPIMSNDNIPCGWIIIIIIIHTPPHTCVCMCKGEEGLAKNYIISLLSGRILRKINFPTGSIDTWLWINPDTAK